MLDVIHIGSFEVVVFSGITYFDMWLESNAATLRTTTLMSLRLQTPMILFEQIWRPPLFLHLLVLGLTSAAALGVGYLVDRGNSPLLV